MHNGERRSGEFNREPSSIDRMSIDDFRDFSERYIKGSIEKNKIDEEDFSDVYSPDEIKEDQVKTAEKQDIYQKSLLTSDLTHEQRINTEKLDILAKQFEAICSDHTVLSRVFALARGEIVAQSASDYDDIFHGTDLLLEFPREKVKNNNVESFTIGMDVTISKHGFKNKFHQLYRHFENHPSLQGIKYYQESGHHTQNGAPPRMGEAEVPKYIINTKPEELVELIEGWKLWKDNFSPVAAPRETQALLEKTGLAKSKIWYRILYQLKLESITFYKYFAESEPELAKVYLENYKLFTKNLSKLRMSYIRANEEWERKYQDIMREKNESDQQARMELLFRNIHEQYNGQDMGYIKSIIFDTENKRS